MPNFSRKPQKFFEIGWSMNSFENKMYDPCRFLILQKTFIKSI